MSKPKRRRLTPASTGTGSAQAQAVAFPFSRLPAVCPRRQPTTSNWQGGPGCFAGLGPTRSARGSTKRRAPTSDPWRARQNRRDLEGVRSPCQAWLHKK
jgi:hypothetical protein